MKQSVADVFLELFRNPQEVLVRHWNWKSAILSSAIRAAIFLFTNLSAGWRAAGGAVLADLLFRPVVSGFLGSLTQALRWAQPVWAATLVAMLLLPAVSHAIEFAVHRMNRTPNLMTSIPWSIGFSLLSTLFNLYAMRRGVMVVNTPDAAPLGSDIRRIPIILGGFLASAPLAAYRAIRRSSGT